MGRFTKALGTRPPEGGCLDGQLQALSLEGKAKRVILSFERRAWLPDATHIEQPTQQKENAQMSARYEIQQSEDGSCLELIVELSDAGTLKEFLATKGIHNPLAGAIYGHSHISVSD